MTQKSIKYAVLLVSTLLFLASLGATLFFLYPDAHREIVRTKEKELKVSLESSFGRIYVSKGDSRKIFTLDIKEKQGKKAKGKVDYDLDGNVGRLDVKLSKYGGSEFEKDLDDEFDHEDLETGKWYLRFTDAIPISFNVELGLGRGEFDCSGLMVKEFNLSTGASSVVLRFQEPNKTVIENMKIESGVSRFVGQSLGNANFRRLSFSGGVGSYTLDLTGNLRQEVDVNVEVGVGAVTIIVPRNVGARIKSEESWFSKIDVDRDFQKKKEGQYLSDNYSSASSRMNISVESSLGHVKIRRVRE